MIRLWSFFLNMVFVLVLTAYTDRVMAQYQIERSAAANGGIGNVSAGGISMGWTIGEAVIQTFSAGGNVLTQGFQQDHFISMGLDKHSVQRIITNVFPNPVKDKLWLELQQVVAVPLQIAIISVNGQVLQQASIAAATNVQYSIDMSTYAAGHYFLVLTGMGGNSKSIKIIKQ